MKRISALTLVTLFVVACGGPATPTPDVVATEVAQALAVVASLTASAPTTTDTPSPTPTSTPTPTPTSTPTATPTPTKTRTPMPTKTRTPMPTKTRTPMPTKTRTPVPATPTAAGYIRDKGWIEIMFTGIVGAGPLEQTFIFHGSESIGSGVQSSGSYVLEFTEATRFVVPEEDEEADGYTIRQGESYQYQIEGIMTDKRLESIFVSSYPVVRVDVITQQF